MERPVLQSAKDKAEGIPELEVTIGLLAELPEPVGEVEVVPLRKKPKTNPRTNVGTKSDRTHLSATASVLESAA